MESSSNDYSIQSQPTLKIPNSLLGKNITVYRGGPESKTGNLLDVQYDYLVLYSENKVIYYQAEHIKSISEDSKNNSIPMNVEEIEEPIFHQENDFISLLERFMRRSIQVNQGGPDAKQGMLLDVGSDYLVLNTDDDGVIYYYLPHIKSIVELQMNGENNDESSESMEMINDEMMPNFLKGSDFNQLCQQMLHKWVSINRNGPEALEGILFDSSGGFYTLANNHEIYRIQPFHVRNISFGPKGAMKQQQQAAKTKETKTKDTKTKETKAKETKAKETKTYETKNENFLDESSSLYIAASSTTGQRNTSGIRDSSDNIDISRERYTSRRSTSSRRTSSRRTSSRWTSSRRTSRYRSSSSYYHSRGRRNRRTSSSSYRSSRRNLGNIIKAINYGWKPM